MEEIFLNFLKSYEIKIIPLSKDANLAYFNASVSGEEEDFQKASELQLKLSKIYTNKEEFEQLKKLKESNQINKQLLKRQLTIIYNLYAGNQFNEELLEKIIKISTKVEEKFSTFRARYNGKELTDNEIDDILRFSNDTDEMESAWRASKDVSREVYEDVIELVNLRNKSAKKAGYKNYHEMSLSLSEQNSDEIESLIDELNDLTKDEFEKLKNDIDVHLSKLYSISKEELMPWHYQDKYFQQGPKIFNVSLDNFFKEKNLVEITRNYFDSIGVEIDDLISKSDLFEKNGKYQHAYCTDIDRTGDIRVVCNVIPNYKWMGTLLHEYGHAIYDKYISPKLPWQLRTPPHIFTTEAIAMLFGRFASNPKWLQDVIGISDEEKDKIASDCFNSLRLEQLVFTRWIQVMYRFEKSMYENPDQDLNKLWWDLVEKYQGLKKPEGRDEPDWASKIHVALYPAYYHNYMLGELLASQLYNYITQKVLRAENPGDQSFNGEIAVGDYLKHLFFSYGSSYHWSELIEKATGEKLTPKYYAEQFVKAPLSMNK